MPLRPSAGLPLTDAGLLTPLPKLGRLRKLSLARTAVTDAISRNMPKSIEELDVSGTRVGDFLMFDLARNVRSLRRLVVTGTTVTPKGIDAVQAALPECEFVHWSGEQVLAGQRDGSRPS